MSNLYVPPCPNTCGSVADVSFNNCAPERHWGEVSKIYLADASFAGFTDVSDLAEWTTNLSDTVDNKIRTLIGIGDVPEPEIVEVETSADRIAVGFKKFTLPFEIDETNDINYNFLLLSECGGSYILWFETRDGMLYGGNDGILVTFRANLMIPRGKTELSKFMTVSKWDSLQSPFRCTSPMA